MAKNLVIVESPAKAKTITKFLGKDYKVIASVGHVRDLPKSDMGIDIEKDFKPKYVVSKDKKNVIKSLKDEIKPDTNIFIATDEDREGEAIGWHVLEALKVKKKNHSIKRIGFHEITKNAVVKSLENPREINQDLVDAQQARRVLDRLVGYELSPLLWKKVKYGLSAGRVQSVAVRLVVEREREIMAFNPEEYWSVTGDFETNEQEKFQAVLKKIDKKEAKITNEAEAKAVLADIKDKQYQVVAVTEKDTSRNPAPPFITSTLQQEASRKLGFSVKKTMMLAQRLYEGIDIGSGTQGLITYMRTDSVNLSKVALEQAKAVVTKQFGKEFALASPRFYKGKKGAQEAHEAIRPVDLSLTPESLAKYLEKDQLRIYELIWKRTLACQMAPAKLKSLAVDIEPSSTKKTYTFRANGQTIVFAGFMRVYVEGSDNPEEELESKEKLLPALTKNDPLACNKIDPKQHFTKPPARYTEASLVKKLESEGIGRPSTYAPTISTIINRGYIEKDGRQLKPLDIAMVVIDLLTKHFAKIVDYKFTARMEEDLDQIADGDKKWVPVIRDFYDPFHQNIEVKEKEIKKEDTLKERIIGQDPKSGLDVVARYGRFGAYVQIGSYTKEEIEEMKEKPRRASLPKGLFFETITLEEAMKALAFPRVLGQNKDGEDVSVNIGRFGPYIKVGKTNASLPKDLEPSDVTLEQACEIAVAAAELKKKQQTPLKEFNQDDPESKQPVLIKTGRFGPYVTDGKTNASIPKSMEPEEVTFEQAVELLAKKRKAPKRGRFAKKKK